MPSTRPVDAETLEELAAAVGCDAVAPLDEMIFPLRSAAARTGVRCDIGSSAIHLFERDLRPADPVGGSLGEIDRSLSTGTATPGCEVFVAVTERFFVVGGEDDLRVLEPVLPAEVREILPASPTVSYLGTGCELSPAP